MRESPVASEKIAVDQASRRPVARFSTRASIGTPPVGTSPIRAWPDVSRPGTRDLLPTASLSAKSALMGARSVPKVRHAGSGTIAAPARLRAFPSDAEHQAAEEARPHLRRGP